MWNLTSAELSIRFDGAAKRLKDDREFLYDLGMFVAWHTAAFYRTKTMPSLAKVLKRSDMKAEPARQSWQEMKALMKQLTATPDNAKPAVRRIKRKA